MKSLCLNIISIFALCSVLGICSGCQHKKQVLVVPQQPPPTAAPSPSPTPEPTAAQPAEQADKTQQTQPSAEQAKPEESQTAQKEAPRHPRKPSPRKSANSEKSTTEVARNTSNKKIIPAEKTEPPLSLPQIAPGPTPADAHDQVSTDQLLRTAESNLNGIKRQLNKDEETMLAQIREFISQSRKATTENDPERAHNLAVKARVLSDELVKQR
jgi:translation initiation factor IF-2